MTGAHAVPPGPQPEASPAPGWTDLAPDQAALWRPDLAGVEVLHGHFHRHAYARHAHETATVALVDRGAITFACGGERHLAPAGSAFLINPQVAHDGRSATPDGYRYRVLYLDGPELAGLVPARRRGPTRLTPFGPTVVADPAVSCSLRAFHGALAGASRLEQETCLLRAVRLLAERCGEAPGTRPAAPPAGHRSVALAREHLEERVTENVSLRELAAIAGTSPSRLVRRFSRELGMPPHAYQTHLRVRRACRALRLSTPPAVVAAESGFYDQAHLTRVFKRHVGVTPARYAAGAAGRAPGALRRAGEGP